MCWTSRVAIIIAALLVSMPSRAADFSDDFAGRKVNYSLWDPCQATKSLLKQKKFTVAGDRRTALRNTVQDGVPNNEHCNHLARPAEGEIAELGPSMFAPQAIMQEGGSVAACVENTKQRNELRAQPDSRFAKFTDPTWYSITFAANGDIPSTGSLRWVVSQWKEGWDPNPYIAQRFDNGVLHVTVQNNNCRCMIAQAPGDVNAIISERGAAPLAQAKDLKPTKPLECLSSADDGSMCGKTCTPTNLTVLTPGGATPAYLPSPKDHWVTMTYLFKGEPNGTGLLDIYADQNFIARVTGLIGYDCGSMDCAKDAHVKFKFGHYRDALKTKAYLYFDRACVGKSAAYCDPKLTPIEISGAEK